MGSGLLAVFRDGNQRWLANSPMRLFRMIIGSGPVELELSVRRPCRAAQAWSNWMRRRRNRHCPPTRTSSSW
jgi:hypothetical protein